MKKVIQWVIRFFTGLWSGKQEQKGVTKEKKDALVESALDILDAIAEQVGNKLGMTTGAERKSIEQAIEAIACYIDQEMDGMRKAGVNGGGKPELITEEDFSLLWTVSVDGGKETFKNKPQIMLADILLTPKRRYAASRAILLLPHHICKKEALFMLHAESQPHLLSELLRENKKTSHVLKTIEQDADVRCIPLKEIRIISWSSAVRFLQYDATSSETLIAFFKNRGSIYVRSEGGGWKRKRLPDSARERRSIFEGLLLMKPTQYGMSVAYVGGRRGVSMVSRTVAEVDLGAAQKAEQNILRDLQTVLKMQCLSKATVERLIGHIKMAFTGIEPGKWIYGAKKPKRQVKILIEQISKAPSQKIKMDLFALLLAALAKWKQEL